MNSLVSGFVGVAGDLLALGEPGKRLETLELMRERISHRGPDAAGSFMDERVAFGFCHLAAGDLAAGALNDGALSDGALSDGALSDGASSDGALSDGALSDGALSDGALSDGASSDGGLSDKALQPLSNSQEDGSIVIVCDGRIYNHLDLRAELEAQGHLFATHSETEALIHGHQHCDAEALIHGYQYSDAEALIHGYQYSETEALIHGYQYYDAEALIHGYQQWGADLVTHVRGPFAFVLYDQTQNMLFGARDPIGLKPLYYSHQEDGNLLFASEIKSFLEYPGFVKELNINALRPYLSFQYNTLEETFFKGVFRLPHAHRFTYQLASGKMTVEQYADADFSQSLPQADKAERSFEACVEALNAAVEESVELQKKADPPVGTFLSGGIDSSYITSLVRPAACFSVGFKNEGFDETTQAQELSEILHIKNHRRLIDPAEGFEAFPTIQYHMDEPLADPSIVPLYFLAQLAREHVSVVLSGEGADELFAGYELYDEPRPTRTWKRRVPAPVRRALSTLAGPLPPFKGRAFLRRGSGRPEDYFIGQAFIFSEKEANALLKPEFRESPTVRDITAPYYKRTLGYDELSKKQYLDMNLWLPGAMLLKADKVSMALSLEVRTPFLDSAVVGEALRTPAAYRVTEQNTKMVLRKAAANHLPAEWAQRAKVGFLTPIRVWLRQDPYYSQVRECFASETAGLFFDQQKLLALLDAHYQNRANNQRKIWTVYSFLVWYQRFFVKEAT